MADLETLTLQINTESSKATAAIDALAQRLNNLSVSIAKLETGKLNDLASGLNNLNAVIYNMNATSSKWDYKRIVGNITSLSAIDTAKLNELSSAIAYLGNSLNGFASTVAISDNVRSLVNAVGRLGGKSVTAAITNIPLLENALAHLITSFSTLPSINQSVIDFTNSLANLASQGQRIGSATNTINNSLDRFSSAATRASRKSFNLASAIGKVYAQFWILMRAVSGLKKSFMNTADYLEAYNYFDVVAGKIGADTFAKAGVGSADDYADAFTSEMRRKLKQMSGLELDLEDRLIKTTNAKSLGLNITEITQYQASIASITNAMGQAQEVSTATAKAFSMLAADMGSLRNVDYEQVAANLQSALTGQARALYKYGIDLTAATLEQYAYANGVDKAVSEMTQAEKAQLRLLAILDQSKVAWGDLANTINSPANQMRQLKTNLEELGTVFGQLFIPVLQRTLPWVNGLSIALKQLLIDIASLLGIELNLDEFGQGFSDTIDEDTEAIDDLNKSMKETKKGIREFDELKVIGGDKSKAGTGLSDQIDLTQQILKATDEYERVWDEAYRRMESKAQEIAEALKGALDPIRKIVEDFHLGNFFEAGEDVSDLAIKIFDFVADAIAEVDWKGIGTKIGEFFDGIKWKDVFASVGNLIGEAIQAVIDLWTGSFSAAPFETALITAFGLLKFTGLGNAFDKTLVKGIKSILPEKLKKIDYQQLGLGAVSIGLGVALTIDNIQSVEAGEYAIYDLSFWLKTGVASLFSGAGLALAATSIGIASGGLAFGIGAAIALIANLAIGNAVMPNSYEDLQKIFDAEHDWITQNNLEAMEVLTNITLRGTLTQESFDNIDDLAEKVLELSKSYETLTDTQKGELKRYSDELVAAVPGIKDQIDEITGAWLGTTGAMEEVIKKEKELLQLETTKENYRDAEKVKRQAESDKKEIEAEKAKADYVADYYGDRIQQAFVDRFGEKEGKFRFDTMMKNITENGWEYTTALFDVSPYLYTQLIPDMRKYTAALAYQKSVTKSLNETNKVLDEATEAYNYWDQALTDAYTNIVKQQEELVGDNEQSIETIKDNIEDSKIPKAVENTMNSVNRKIADGDRISTSEMNTMFNNINNSFAHLSDGKVPEEVQTTMDNIKLAILNNSPSLCNYMQLLKIQMEKAFADAHYTGNEMIWNPNNISARLGQDVGKIEENLRYTAKPAMGTLEDDLKELFGGELPEEVDKALKRLSDTIKNGEGTKAVTEALNDLKVKFLTIAADGGKYIDLGLGYSIDQYGRYVYTAMDNVVDGTETTFMNGIEANSPSRLFRRLAQYIPEGMALGIKDESADVTKAINSVISSMQSTFAGFAYNIPSLNFGSQNRNQYYGNDNRYSDAATSLYDAMSRAYSQMGNGQTEVVFRVEGDPYGIFKVVRAENDKYKNRTQRSAF